MNSFKPEMQKHNSENLKPILIRKDNGDNGKNNASEPKKRVTFKQCVEYLPNYQEMEIDQSNQGAGEPANNQQGK